MSTNIAERQSLRQLCVELRPFQEIRPAIFYGDLILMAVLAWGSFWLFSVTAWG